MTRRRGLIIAFVGLLVIFIGILIIRAALGRATVPPTAEPTLPPPPTEKVLITTHAIPLRALLKAEDLRVVDVPVDLAPPGGLSDESQAIGRITKIPLAAGEMVLGHHLADPTNISQDIAFIVGDDQVVLAVPTNDLMSQINILQPGDLVDVLASLEVPIFPLEASLVSGEIVEPPKELFTFDALQHLTIQAIVVEITQQPQRTSGTAAASRTAQQQATPEPTPTPSPAEITPRAILLALAPQDALALKHILDAGGIIDIVLRAPTSTRQFQLDPVMADYLTDRYELHAPR